MNSPFNKIYTKVKINERMTIKEQWNLKISLYRIEIDSLIKYNNNDIQGYSDRIRLDNLEL